MEQSKLRILEMKSEIIQAAAHPIRLAIIEYLEGGEQCVCDIVSHVEAQRSNVSRHLAGFAVGNRHGFDEQGIGNSRARPTGTTREYHLKGRHRGRLQCRRFLFRQETRPTLSIHSGPTPA